jgi:hypothetical protein
MRTVTGSRSARSTVGAGGMPDGIRKEKRKNGRERRRKEQGPMRQKTIRALFANGAKIFLAHAEIAGI